MPSKARNQDKVPPEDLPFFIAATTAGLRRQLQDANIPSGGLKYELYVRLRANGLRIYNDVRIYPEPEDSDDSSWDDSEDDGDDEDEDEDDEESDGDESEDDSSSEDDPEEPPSGSRSGKKRKREADTGEDKEEPEAPRPTSLANMPAEMTINIIRNLDAMGVFNSVSASPQQFLLGNVNAFVLEAEGRRTAAGRNGLSLLEWVMARAGSEVEFRTDNRGLIRRVVDAYLETYPSASPRDRSGEARVEEIMVYLRQVGVNPVLGSAVRQGEADIVQLLILLGEDVNQRVNNLQPLEEATVLISPFFIHMNRLRIVFALLAGGADTTSTRDDYPTSEPVSAIVPFRGVARAAESHWLSIVHQPTWTPVDHPVNWQVIQNPRDLTIREFLADERSPFMDRITLALVLIMTRGTYYPNFEGYNPTVPDFGRTV